VLWGIESIVCMCIIIDITDIVNDCMGTSRVFGGGWAAIIVSIWREGYNYLLFSSRHTETSVHDLLYRVFRFWLLNISAILFRVWLLLW
jgi:hypothetical protein